MMLPVMDERLAARIRQSETDYFASRIGSIGERPGNPMGVEISKFGDTTAFYVREMPWGLFNSVKGFSDADADRLEEIVRFYRERNRAFQLDANPLDCSPKLLRTMAGYRLYQESFHTVLYGPPLREAPALPSGVRVREVADEADFDHYAEIHCVGSGMSASSKHHFVANNIGLLNRPGWRLFLATLHDIPAAVGVMHIGGDGIASCTLAATLPDCRGNGLQTALLQRRMHEAYAAGCELVVAQASYGSSSQRNMMRAGMQVAWTRAVWAPVSIPT